MCCGHCVLSRTTADASPKRVCSYTTDMRSIPTPPDAGVIDAVRFGTDTFRYLDGIQTRYDDALQIPIPTRPPLVIVTNPTLARDLLSRPDDFGRVPARETDSLIASQGLVQSEGELWEQQRSVVAPAFSGRQVAAYADTVGRRVEALAEEWADRDDDDIDLHREMTTLTVRVATEVLLGKDIGRERAVEFHEWMAVAGEELEFGIDIATPEWLPTRVSPAFREAAANIRGLAEDMIEDRRESLANGEHTGPPDMLTILIQREDDPDVEYPENQIRDEVATFLIAGHETTALSLTYTLALLSDNPEVRESVRTEARGVIGDGPLDHDDVDRLPATQRAYNESLRLYPPAWGVFRQANHATDLGDYDVPDGAATIVPLWSIHRDARHFESPDSFDPSRWERRSPTSVDAYFPFSTGPHACIGRSFALSGATLALARLVADFDVDVPPGALDDLRLTPTLRPRDGVPATLSTPDDR
ncbi:cytochrome P450 [Halosegnis longus]|uniref:Cytochrome P450 n=2 Tax=Halosegnis longus TaxID=2216012 RepID=A0AAJ4R914_9EURY|nr:cytochrome P450 [Salella cibi]